LKEDELVELEKNKYVTKEIKNIPIANTTTQMTNIKVSLTKKQEILNRIKGLGVELEEEKFNNMLQVDYSDKSYSIAENLAKGIYKNEYIQTRELVSKQTETVKV
jgi:hypothetical protein